MKGFDEINHDRVYRRQEQNILVIEILVKAPNRNEYELISKPLGMDKKLSETRTLSKSV